MSLWPSTKKKLTSDAKNSISYLKMQTGKTDAFHFSHHSHALVTLHVQFLCYDWSKFDRWVHGENLCSVLRLVYFDGVLRRLVMFLTVFFHWMYKIKYSCYQESSVIHGWFVYWVFGWEMRRLSKPIIRFRMASFLFFTLLDACENYKGSSDPCLSKKAKLLYLYLISWSRAQFMKLVYARLY